MKNYVITGGAGFIGSHIAEFLSQQGHNVTVLDSLRTGFEKNLQGLNVNFVNGDIRDEKLVEKLVGNADGVFHLAALVSVPESLLKIKECIDINTIGTINILEAAKTTPIVKSFFLPRLRIMATIQFCQKWKPMLPEPHHSYAITKLDGEYYLKMYLDQYNLQTASLRYFERFGPRQNPQSAYAAAVPIFINKALNK